MRCSIFLRLDLKWIWFSLKFDAFLLVITVAAASLAGNLLDVHDIWRIVLAMACGQLIFTFAEPFIWRYRTLRRTTYYVTNQRVVSVPGRRARSVRLAEIDNPKVASSPSRYAVPSKKGHKHGKRASRAHVGE